MTLNKKTLKYAASTIVFSVLLYIFYLRYVPLLKGYQICLMPILIFTLIITALKIQWGMIFFIFLFPLINILPYLFGIYEHIPHAPSALVLFLFFFLGWMLNQAWSDTYKKCSHQIFKPMFFFSVLVILSGIITFLRYSNFFPFLSSDIYELITNVDGVSSGGAIMSTVFFGLNYLSGFAFFYITYQTIDSMKFIQKIIFTLCLSTFISLVFGYYQYLKDIKIGNTLRNVSQGLINGTFKDAISFGTYLSMVSFLFLGFFMQSKKFSRYISILVVLLSGFMIFFVGARGGLLGFYVSFFVFVILIGIKMYSRQKKSSFSAKTLKLAIISLSAILVILVLVVVLLRINNSEVKTWVRIDNFLKKDIHNFWATPRGQSWQAAIHMIKDYPLSGVGLGGFIIEVSNYAAIHNLSIPNYQSCENYLLQVSSELGLFGLFLVFWIFWEIFKQIRKNYLKFSGGDKNIFLFTGAVGGIVSYLINIQAHTYIGSYEIKYTFWLMIALIFLLNKNNKREETR